MANEENLIPINKRTKAEQREIARKGGKASGKVRRKKADLKKAMKALLVLDVDNEVLKKRLEELGLDGDNQSLLVLNLFQQAVRGNQRAVENIIKLTTEKKDSYDIKEQKCKLKLLEQQIEEFDDAKVGEQVVFVNRWDGEEDE